MSLFLLSNLFFNWHNQREKKKVENLARTDQMKCVNNMTLLKVIVFFKKFFNQKNE